MRRKLLLKSRYVCHVSVRLSVLHIPNTASSVVKPKPNILVESTVLLYITQHHRRARGESVVVQNSYLFFVLCYESLLHVRKHLSLNFVRPYASFESETSSYEAVGLTRCQFSIWKSLSLHVVIPIH